MRVRAIKDYYDLELQKNVDKSEEFEVSAARAKVLSSADNNAKQPLVEIIEAAPVKKTAAKKKTEDK